ncbi:hypothetical protein Tco_0789955 [Tanacetum coccineum]
MVLSLTYSTPPKRNVPSLEESIASIADSLSKLVASQTAFTAQLKIIIEKQQQTLSLISPIIQTNQQDSNTPTVTSTQPIITIPSNNHGLQILPATPENPMAQVITVLSSSITKMENEVATQLQTPLLLPVLAPPTNPFNYKSSKVQHEIVIFHPTNLYNQTCHLATLAKDKFTLGQVWFSPSPLIGLCFCILKTFPPGLPCIPPMFVLLEPECNTLKSECTAECLISEGVTLWINSTRSENDY